MAPVSPHISRRDAVKRIGAAGVTALVPTAILRGQSTDIRVAGRAVEIAVTSLSRHTVRLTIAPIEGGHTAVVPLNGGLVNVEASRVESRIRRPTRPVRLGDLTVRFTTDPPTIHVDTNRGTVYLNGSVDTAEQKARTERAAKRASGVKGVVNNLKVHQKR